MAIRRTKKRRTSKKRRPSKTAKRKSLPINLKAQIKAFRTLETKAKRTWAKLQRDVKRKNFPAIQKGRAELILILGECKYMADQYKRSKQFKS